MQNYRKPNRHKTEPRSKPKFEGWI